ncbi:MAG: hypothetical protein ACRDTE_18510 [Pseudonocardiaceae bacterium]
MKLCGPDYWSWLGLRRVNCGAVARFEGVYYDAGQPIPGCLYEELFTVLLERGLLEVADPDTEGMARVSLSEAGRPEYRALCQRQRRHPDGAGQ